MGFGIFGKLPQKRDFIALGIRGDVLTPLENWLQAAVAASRSELGRAWEELYLVAPIWRFWIGRNVFGAGCAGVLMPSVDGVGRFFPLMAVYVCDGEEQLAPPAYAPQEKWFRGIEERLLPVLDEGATLAVDKLLEGLPPPAFEPPAVEGAPVTVRGGLHWQGEAEADVPTFLAATFEDDYREVARGRSYFWTVGNETRGPLLYARQGLPDPYFHTLMLKTVAE